MYWPADPRRLHASPVQSCTQQQTWCLHMVLHCAHSKTSLYFPQGHLQNRRYNWRQRWHLPNNTQLYRDVVSFEAIFERTQSHQSVEQHPVCTKTVTHMLRLVSIYNFLLLWIYYWFLLRHRMNKATILPLTLLSVLAKLYAPGTFCTKRSTFNKYDTRRKQAEPLQRHLHTDKKLYKQLLNIVTIHTEPQSTSHSCKVE